MLFARARYTEGVKDHYVAWHGLRFLVAGALALLVVLAVLYATLSYMSASSGGAKKASRQQYSDTQKLEILHGLAASTSTSSDTNKRKTLQQMQATTSVSESQKLDILKGLNN